MDELLGASNGPDVFLIIGIITWILIIFGIILIIVGATLNYSWAVWTAAGILGVLSIVGGAVLSFGFFWKKRIGAGIEGAIQDKRACKTVARYCQISIKPVECSARLVPEFDSVNPYLAEFCGRNIYHLEVVAKRYFQVHGKESTTMISEFPFPSVQLVGLITKQLHNNDTPISGIVCVCRETQTCFIFLRGTITMNEWKQDLNFKTTSVSRLFESGIECDPKVKVHTGFMQIFLSLCESFDNVMKTVTTGFQIKRIVISGHSLGGALASEFSFYLASHGRWKSLDLEIHAYTFGKPRVGNIEYSKCFNAKSNLRLIRFENVNDPVPQLPLACSPNLVFPSEPFVFQHEGTAVTFDTNLSSLGLNHYMMVYLDYIQTLVQ